MAKLTQKALFLALLLAPATAFADIKLLEPVGGVTTIPNSGGFTVFFAYANALFPIVVGSGAGICIVWGLYAGIRMMMAGGDSGAAEEGKKRLIQAITALVIVLFSGMILRFLNPAFYQ